MHQCIHLTSVGWSVSWSVKQKVRQSVKQSLSCSVRQPTKQFTYFIIGPLQDTYFIIGPLQQAQSNPYFWMHKSHCPVYFLYSATCVCSSAYIQPHISDIWCLYVISDCVEYCNVKCVMFCVMYLCVWSCGASGCCSRVYIFVYG